MINKSVFSLEGKLALITGGGTGIGYGIAKAFIEAGAKVIITGRREEVLQEAVSSLGPNVLYRVNDVTDLASLPGLIENIEAEVGAINILVNNAGLNQKKDTLSVSDQEFQEILQTNLTAVFALTRECAIKMRSRGEGVILLISSMAAYYGLDRVLAYSASKSAIRGMVMPLAQDFSPLGIRVNAIAPGFIDSPMFRKAMEGDPKRLQKVLDRTPVRTLGLPQDIGNAAVFLASDAAKFITGVCLPVDGGNSIGF